MRIPLVKAARRALISVIILVLLAVMVNYLLIWHSRSQVAKKTPQILSPEMARSAESPVIFERKDGIVRFKIRARRLLETRLGKSLLEGIEAYDLNPDGSVHNEIHSQNAEYDRDRKLVDFYGNVRLFLRNQVELRTNSLHYDLNTNIGTTSDVLQFYSSQGSGTARGIRFDQKQESLDLGGEVDFTIIQKNAKPGSPAAAGRIRATSERAYCSQITRQIIFTGNARVASDSGFLSGDAIEAILSADQKRLTSLTSTGNAVYQSVEESETRSLSGDRLVFGIGESGALEKISAMGQAEFSSISPSEEEDLRGGEIDLEYDAAKSMITQIQSRTGVVFRMKRGVDQTTASGDQLTASFIPETKSLSGVHVRGHSKFSMEGAKDSAGNELEADDILMSFREIGGRAVSEKLRAEGSARWVSKRLQDRDRARREPERTLTSSLLEMEFSSEGDFLESVRASDKVVISEGSSVDPDRPQTRRLLADSARFRFFPQDNRIQDMNAEGHVQTIYEKRSDSAGKPAIEEFRTASEKIKALFSPKTGDIESATQWGNFSYKDASRSATAGRCDYDATKDIVILKESPRISDPMGSTTGDRVEYEQKGKVLSVHGKVRSMLKASKGESLLLTSSSSSQPSIVTADAMQYWTEAGRLRYTGKVQLLSEDQQLQARVVEIFGGGERVEAQGEVLHLVPGKKERETAAQPGKPKGSRDSANAPITIQSSNLKYFREKDAISYSGNVALRSGDLNMSSNDLDAVLDKDGKNVKRATANGRVLIHQGLQECKGETADWYLDEGKLVVVGKPAEIFDPKRGRSFARRLTSFRADDRILLENR
jgi:LPS export ABC transporter protein LptC